MQRSTSATSVSSTGAPRCRLCWGEETEEAAGGSPLITPCNCRGTVGFIHVHCLQHWLEVKRQQGASRNRTVRCEVCNSKYNTAQVPTVPGRSPLLPRLWGDPYAIAALLHGAWRAYVVTSGMYYAYTIYASINKGVGAQQPLVRTRLRSSSSSTAIGSAGAAAAGGAGGLGGHLLQQQQQQHPLRHHLSLSLPVGTPTGRAAAGPGAAAAGAGAGAGGGGGGGRIGGLAGVMMVPRDRVDGSLLTTIRERFDKATMVQVYWYTGLMGLMPTPPNSDAFAGMAVGATVGGMVAQLVFLPMLGSGKLAALGCSCRLLLRCLLRLLAAEACQARGYRVLAGLIRGLMQRWQRWHQRRRRQQQEQQQQQRQAAAEGIAAVAAAGVAVGGDGGVNAQPQAGA